ncbi:hypothetical protein CEUSTIGMA_g277.t1 [Chlamydomonas eustigma]|uniref:Glutamine amidotransferase type-2 domain-containing protein n=1 Tax=Chlamydomonas eustigma TaxID=1157962 RepID=A0A250WQ82_9CHLO|nr:hypothetical protein CEUSTIGMA_g277.t1 [Chlamydomonas eustigma]|eukprot:GAX72822.1 hypothetical protein CEUSTIGMA_g277.t1 [Chlamydomonas eustigma]
MDIEGVFFARVVKPRSWYSFGKQEESAKCVDNLFKTFSQKLEDEVVQSPDGVFAKISKAPQELSLSPRQTHQSKVQKYVVGSDNQCAMTVLPAASSISGHLLRVLPYVYCREGILLCFFGFLKNIKDIEERLDMTDDIPFTEDVGDITTGVIVALYKKLQRSNTEKPEELLLSELQGNYAFFLFDSQRKQAMAVRDPTGEQELFYYVEPEDGSVAFTNSLGQLPRSEQQRGWREVPPGHYVCGRTPMLKQFALTPEQLQMRERTESEDISYIEEEDSLRMSPSKGYGLLARISQKLKV